MKNNYYDKSNEFNTDDLDTLKDLASLKDLDFQARLDIVPENPGVYMMKDVNGKIIYVGKAKNLRRRLSSYFMKNVKGNIKVHAMVERIADFSYLICNSELEALILESNLIKRYQPFYNILLKDDRDYPYMRISMNEMYPRVEKAYRIAKDREEGCKYYGPYLNADLKSALKTIHEIFPLKTCKRVFPRDIGKERPCIQYFIGRCIGPCRGDVSAEEYRKVCENVCAFLEGRYDELLKEVESQMRKEADKLDFKSAARSRDRLKSLEKLFERQKVVSTNDEEADILSIESNELESIIVKLELRSGKISGTSSYFFTMNGDSIDSNLDINLDSYIDINTTEADSEILQTRIKEKLLHAFITQYYPNASYIPHQIIVDQEFEEKDILEAYLKELKGKKVRIIKPKRAFRKELLDMAKLNAKQSLERHSFLPSRQTEQHRENLELLKDYLSLTKLPKRIEAYDIANLGNDAQVAAMVVFEDGKLQRKLGRAFYIKKQNFQNDYAAMYEVIDRRLTHLGKDEDKFGAKPDLILLDGGIGHLNTIKKLFQDRKISNIDLAAMVKDKKHRSRGLVRSDGNIIELSCLAKINSEDADKKKISNNESCKLYKDENDKIHFEKFLEDILMKRKKGIYGKDNSKETGVNCEPDNIAEQNLNKRGQLEQSNNLNRLTHDISDDFARKERQKQEQALQLLRFVTAIQNEVHRSAGEHHKKLKNKKTLRFTLENIKGIGEARRKLLMKEFGTIKAISEASSDEIHKRCPSISKKQAGAIYDHFHEDTEKSREEILDKIDTNPIYGIKSNDF